jgi:Protein of unknown function (DUF3060)
MKGIIALALALAPTIAAAEKSFVGGQGDWDCGKDPVVSITRGQGNYTFTGKCTTIAIQGGENKLKIESVDALKIVGGNNEITVDTIDSIKIVGAGNKLTWKKAKSGDKPKVSAVGGDNKIGKAN